MSDSPPLPNRSVVRSDRSRVNSNIGGALSHHSSPGGPPMASDNEALRLRLEYEREKMAERDREREERDRQREYELQKLQLEIQLAQTRGTAPPTQPSNSRAADDLRSPNAKDFSRAASSLSVLSGQNAYSNWAYRLRQIARNASLLGHLDGSSPTPDVADTSAHARHLHEAGTISDAILNHVSDSVLPLLKHLGDSPTPKDLLDELERLFNRKDANHGSEVFSTLTTLHFDETGDFDVWTARIRELWTSLAGTDFALHERAVCQIIIQAMPDSFQPVLPVLRNQPESSRSIAGVTSTLRQHWVDLKRRGAIPSSNSPNSVGAFAAGVSRDYYLKPPPLPFKRNGQKDSAFAAEWGNACRACWSKSHHFGSKECSHYDIRLAVGWYSLNKDSAKKRSKSKQANAADADTQDDKAGAPAPSPPRVQVEGLAASGFSGGGGIELVDGVVVASPAYINEVEASAANSRPDEFLLDTGAEIHMTALRDCFEFLTPLQNPIAIRGIGGKVVYAEFEGDILLPVVFAGSVSWVRIKGVVYAPDLGRNLIAVGRLYLAGIRLDWGIDNQGCALTDASGSCIARANFSLKHAMWSLNVDLGLLRQRALGVQVSSATTTDAMLWHRRMNHLSAASLRTLSTSGAIPKLSEKALKLVQDCGTCIKGKGWRLPFGSSSSSTERPLQLAHSDLCGPLPASVGGYRYFGSFIDDFTRVAWIFLLKTKDEYFPALKRFLPFVERQSGSQLSTLRTDGGGEYVSHAMADFLADRGIEHQTTAPNSSQQNGVAERFNRTLLDRVRCMLLEADMAKGWWAEAACTAVYVLNRSPHSSLNGRLPLSLWSNKSVSIANLRVFGSKCFAIDTYRKDGKLADRATECRFLGYDGAGKCWRVQVVGSTKVWRSRDVRFIEPTVSPPVNLDHADALPLPSSDVDDHPEGPAFAPTADDRRAPDSVGEEDVPPEDFPADLDALLYPLENPPAGFDVPGPRRSSRLKARASADASAAYVLPPRSYKDAMSRSDSDDWESAWKDEFAQWKKLDVYEVVRRTKGMKVIPTMAVFANKTNELGEVVRKKGRCVARGDQQKKDPSSSTFCPVARLATFRALTAKAAITNGQFKQMDVTTAFLHAPLKETVYLSVPPGFPPEELIPHVPSDQQALRLKKAVYGLVQSARAWYDHVCEVLGSLGFSKSENDQCLFWIDCPGTARRAYVLVYVDDLTLACDSEEQMVWLQGLLTSKLDLKDLGEANQFLGLEIVRDREAGSITLLQRKFIRALLEDYGMSDCRPLDTPMFANALSSLPSHLEPLSDEDTSYMRDKPYRALLGSLNWIGLGTRPDICYALARLGQAQSNPHPAHWQALTHVLRYLSSTLDMGLRYSRSASGDPFMYTDSAFADCPFTRKSHSGYVALTGGAAIAWSSRKQSLVTTSSTEAEYVAMGHATKEAMWLSRLLTDLGLKTSAPMRIYADNQSSIILADSERLSSRTKHLDPQYHFIRQEVKRGTIVFEWIPSLQNAADCLTKPLGPVLFKSMPPMLGLPWIRRQYSPAP